MHIDIQQRLQFYYIYSACIKVNREQVRCYAGTSDCNRRSYRRAPKERLLFQARGAEASHIYMSKDTPQVGVEQKE
jgi:hypothetical protein